MTAEFIRKLPNIDNMVLLRMPVYVCVCLVSLYNKN